MNEGGEKAADLPGEARTDEGRRRFLKTSAMVSVLPLAQVSLGGTALAAPARAFHKMIYDRRLLGAAQFAHAAVRADLTVQAVEGDVTRLWSEDLYAHWQAKPLAVGGLTTESAAYCLEVFARDAGLRTVFRSVQASDADLSETAAAALVSEMLAVGIQPGRPVPLDYAPRLTPVNEPLVAWVIAPVRAV